MKKLLLIIMMLFSLTACGTQSVQEPETEPATVPATEAATVPTAPETEPPTEEAQEEKTYAPDFAMVDAEGNEVHLSDFVGKPVILNFWASWCGPCKAEMPDFEEAYKEYGDEINFVIVNLTDGSRETLETAASFLAGAGYTFPVYFDTAGNGAMTYGVNSIPRTYFIDAEGVLVAYAASMIDASLIAQGIGMILE